MSPEYTRSAKFIIELLIAQKFRYCSSLVGCRTWKCGSIADVALGYELVT